MQRNAGLDGMRGVAALTVVLSHIVAGFLPTVYFGKDAAEQTTWHSIFAATPGFIVINGSFAVYIFFVLSGYVIAASSERTTLPLFAQCSARLFRLSLPCAAAIIMTFTLFKLNAMHMISASEIIDHPWIRSQYSNSDISWGAAFAEAMGAYYIDGESSLLPVLWTMQRELLGSLGIYVIFKLTSNASVRLILYLLASAICVVANLQPQYYICFAAGAAMHDLGIAHIKCPKLIVFVAITLGIFFGGKPFFSPPSHSVYFPLVKLTDSFDVTGLIYPAGAVLLVFGALTSPGLQNVLGGRCGVFLGRISFPLYLVHFPLLGSVEAAGFVYFGHMSSLAFVTVTLFYMSVVVAVTLLFDKLVERPTLKLLRSMKKSYERHPRLMNERLGSRPRQQRAS